MLNICLPPAHQSLFPIFFLLISLACCRGNYSIVKRSTTLVRRATTSRQIRSTESTAPAFYRSYQYLADPRMAASFWQPALEQFGTWLNAVLIILFTNQDEPRQAKHWQKLERTLYVHPQTQCMSKATILRNTNSIMALLGPHLGRRAAADWTLDPRIPCDGVPSTSQSDVCFKSHF